MFALTSNCGDFLARIVQSRCLVAVLMGLLASPVYAQHSDIFLANVSDQVMVGGAIDLDGEAGGPFFELESNLFEGVLISGASLPFLGFDYLRNEPGFNAQPSIVVPGSNPLPANAIVSIELANVDFQGYSGSLFYWDGTGELKFTPAAPVVATFDNPLFGATGAAGGLDDHPLFALNLPGAGVAADGVYLAAYSVLVTNLTPSAPFFIAWLVDSLLVDGEAAEELEGLLEAFENGGPEPIFGGKNFAFYEEALEALEGPPVPEPTSLGLLVSALGGLVWFVARPGRVG